MRNSSIAKIEAYEDVLPGSPVSSQLALPSVLGQHESQLLLRMFRDPRILTSAERTDLVSVLRTSVELAPKVPEVRVLLGMALCVDLNAQEALDVLREAVAMAPNCFIARLKFGELLMRLRICDQAAEQTHQAALLASNAAQSELARRQAATIRTMQREGIERGGYSALIPAFFRRRKSASRQDAPLLAATK